MIDAPIGASGHARLRVIFDDAVMSFAMGDQPSLADIARLLTDTAAGGHGAPLAIDIAWLDAPRANAGAPARLHA